MEEIAGHEAGHVEKQRPAYHSRKCVAFRTGEGRTTHASKTLLEKPNSQNFDQDSQKGRQQES